MGLFYDATYCIDWTVTLTSSTTSTFLGVDYVRQHIQERLATNFINIMIKHGVERHRALKRTPLFRLNLKVMNCCFHISQFINKLTSNNMFLNNHIHILGFDVGVGDIVGENAHYRTFGTESKASRCHHIDHIVDAVCV